MLTGMDEPLASAAGNALEVLNAVHYLTGRHRDPRLHAVMLALGAELLVMSKRAKDFPRAQSMLNKALDSGGAAERFQRDAFGESREKIDG